MCTGVFVVSYCAEQRYITNDSVSIQLQAPFVFWTAWGWNYQSHFPPPSEVSTANNNFFLLFFSSSIWLSLAFSKPLPPSNKVLNVPRICLSDQQGVKGHQELPLPLSQETSRRKAKGERVRGTEGELERKEGGDIQNATMTRTGLELACSFCLCAHIHKCTHSL